MTYPLEETYDDRSRSARLLSDVNDWARDLERGLLNKLISNKDRVSLSRKDVEDLVESLNNVQDHLEFAISLEDATRAHAA
jgi:hypothetical protein